MTNTRIQAFETLGATGEVWVRDTAAANGGAYAPMASGGDTITVNGAAVVDADFDSVTPAAPANGRNVIFQKDASSPANISAHILGNGNAAQYLDGTGNYSTPSTNITVGSTTATSGTTGSVLFVGAGPVIAQDNANLFWDNTNDRLGIGTASPSYPQEIRKDQNASTWIGITNATNGTSALVGYYVNNGTKGFGATYRAAAYTDDPTLADSGVLRTDSGCSGGLHIRTGGTQSVKFGVSDTVRVDIANTETVVNDSGANYDFRVEGDTRANLLFVDASVDCVGFDNTAPVSRVDIDGSLGLDITSVAANTTLDVTHHTVLVNASGAARTITLPAASGCTRRIYVIKKTDSSANAVTVDANASETIDGALTYTLSVQHETVTIQCDGSNWWVL